MTRTMIRDAIKKAGSQGKLAKVLGCHQANVSTCYASRSSNDHA